ncbi:Helicase ATP-binding domain-containing protein [Heracleum sosnowskyi]|uniref:Helicase ATP-binding domain-containing protein n=1 Tax=Heracleum sosnowskyi TaxID=360622 RepID=A0AAD8MBQ2_9APIA|nr:Helicase ATP-binding domain-containing protein [Heracleum sosnowskyi]
MHLETSFKVHLYRWNLYSCKGDSKNNIHSPFKGFSQEKLRDWDRKLGSWGINCLELTGDNEFYNIKTIQEADIILTTPEKFDAVTQYRIKDGGLSFFSDIALVLIDEVHLLNDPRGAALEAIFSRLKMISCNPEMKSSVLAHVRFLSVSATIPNIEDVAEWLRVPVQGIKRNPFLFPDNLFFQYVAASKLYIRQQREANRQFLLSFRKIGRICISCVQLGLHCP